MKEMLLLKVKKTLENAVIPQYQSNGAACFDLVAATKKLRPEKVGPVLEYDTGIAVEVPPGHVGLIFPRSSITTGVNLTLGNCVGVIDSDYRGSIKFQFKKSSENFPLKDYDVGDRIGQMMIIPIPFVDIMEVQELSETLRGEAGFGSTKGFTK